MRRRDHPSLPSAITCFFLSVLKTLLIPSEPIRALSGVNVPGFPMAGFQVTLYGRIWVTPEAIMTMNEVFGMHRREFLSNHGRNNNSPEIGHTCDCVKYYALSDQKGTNIRASTRSLPVREFPG